MPLIEIKDCENGIISGNIAAKYKETDNAEIDIADSTNIMLSGNNIQGRIVVSNTPEVAVKGNKSEGVVVSGSAAASIVDNEVDAGTIVVDGSDRATVAGNVVSVEDDGTATSKAIHLTGTMDGAVVARNTYRGVPEGATGSVVDFGLLIDDTVTGTEIGWNSFGKAAIPIKDNSFDSETLDALELSFGLDVATLTVGNGFQPYPYTGVAEVVGARAVVGVAPAGDDIAVNVNINGSSIWSQPSNVATILDGTKDSGFVRADLFQPLADGDVLTVDVMSVGSTTPGGYLTVIVYVRQ